MIRKVALAQALREAFPKSLGGMYTAEEQGQVEPEETANVIDMQPAAEAPVPETIPEVIPEATPTQDVAATLFG